MMNIKQPSHKTGDHYLFSGNHHESVPRTLFLDARLTPIERNAWQVIRMMLEPDGITALPTYEQLRGYLTSVPYAGKASFETVARALTILRLTRWLSLSKKRRNKDGMIQSNLYILHDDPLIPFEAMQLDDDYLALVCQSISHASKSIQRVAVGVLEDIEKDAYLSGKKLPTRLEVLLGRVESQTAEKLSTGHESEDGSGDLLRNQNNLASDSEAGLKPAKNNAIRNPNKAVSSSNLNNILLQEITSQLDIPARFFLLTESQQKGIVKTISKLPNPIQQQIFIEWEERCQGNTVRRPAAYLYGIAQKAFKGELNEYATAPLQPTNSYVLPITPSITFPKKKEPEPTPEERLLIQQHIRDIRKMIGRS